MPPALRTLTAIAALLCIAAGFADSDPLASQRARFLEAYKALQESRLNDYRRLAPGLTGYPLYRYLEFEELRTRLSRASAAELGGFIERYEGEPVSWRLRRSWLYNLARHRQWEQFLKAYREPQPVALQCYRLQALLARPLKTDAVVTDALQLWMVGKSQDDACDPVFDYLYKHDHITDDLVWQRIRLAMDNGNASLAGFLAKRLPEADRNWVTLWREARMRPAQTLEARELRQDSPQAREIALYAIQRLAGRDAGQAHRRWQSLREEYDFQQDQVLEVERIIAMAAVWQDLPTAHAWLVEVPEGAVDETVRAWRIRTALAEEDWSAVAKHIEALPAEEAQREEWRYWHAVALEQTERRIPAMDEFAQLAILRDYHGFLAADYLRWPYQMSNQPVEYTPEALQALAQRPGFVRARELYRAELFTDARREWQQSIEGMSDAELKLAAVLAQQWGWHDRAILTIARSGDYDDLALRFPLSFSEAVQSQARDRRLDPGHVYAVIRQESAFNKDARSHAGAMGLMQLMPKTGQATARRYDIPLASTRNLFEPDKNISIGSAYLKQVMELYDNNIVLASAAYNAGPHRVRRWLPESESRSAASWIALIPFTETRKYVQRVLAYAAIYDWRMQREITPLHEHMPTIMPRAYYEKFAS
ncbi:MAG TPA: transglycosylase SLT domain-containing protein [Gammaproteobacteria bacterium]|nr:transglycosylase SLT domain-containing protein [Gammaproteobacteria bacterium]